MISNALKAEKLKEIKKELQDTGLWLAPGPGRESPQGAYRQNEAEEFVGWLQVVCGQDQPQEVPGEKKFVVPQAIRVFGDEVNRGNLLQLLIELDAIL